MRKCTKVSAAPVTALDVSPDAAYVAAATSEGELIVLAAGSLQKLVKMQPHDIFITNLRFGHNAVVTCAGDNSNTFTPLTPEMLKPSSGYWLSMLVLLVAVAIALFQMMGTSEGAASIEAVATTLEG